LTGIDPERAYSPKEIKALKENFLVSKLPAPVEEDLSKGILAAIDMDSYRVETKAAVKIQLQDSFGRRDRACPDDRWRPQA
jgi:hypothetical protein